MAIVIADQFNLEVNKSLDDRLVVDSTTTLYSKFNNLNSYIGMMVYVEAENAYYSLNEYTEAGNADSTCWSKVMSVSGDGETSVDHATSADQATSDSEGQNIAETYVKNLTNHSNGVINVVKGDDSSSEVTVYTHPSYTTRTSGLYKITVDATGHVSTVTPVAKSDITDLGIPGSDTTYNVFNTTTNGLVPAPTSANTTKFLRGDGSWVEIENFLSLDGGTINDGGYIYFGAEHETSITDGSIKVYNASVNTIYSKDGNTVEIISDVDITGRLDTNGNSIDLGGPSNTKGNIEGAGTITADTFIGAFQGTADTATKLATPRSINGTQFDGSADITTANWGTARNITIGNAIKSVNGGTNVTWTLEEIGAATSNHNHDTTYLKLSGGIMTGEVYWDTEYDYYTKFNSTEIETSTITINNLTAFNDNVTVTGNLKINGEITSVSSIIVDILTVDTDLSMNGIIYMNNNDIIEAGAIDADSVEAETITATTFEGSLTGNASTATKLQTARTIALSGAATGTATSFDGTKNITIPVTTLDATKLTGMIPITSIPQSALERLVPVANQAARFALTTDDVQLGDTVKEQDTGKMYYVVDTSNLDSEDGYEVYTAGAASSVPWSGITGKPSTFTPSAHVHNIGDINGFENLTVKLGTGTTQTYNPSTALSLEITPAAIGAAATNHNHDTTYLKLSGGDMASNATIAFPYEGDDYTTSIARKSIHTDTLNVNEISAFEEDIRILSRVNFNNSELSNIGTMYADSLYTTSEIEAGGSVTADEFHGTLATNYLVDGDEELIIFGGTALD